MSNYSHAKAALSFRGDGDVSDRWLSAALVIFLLSLSAICTDSAAAEQSVQIPISQRIQSPLYSVGACDHGEGSRLRLNPDLYKNLKQRHEVTITGFSLAPGRTVDLELKQFSVFSAGTQFIAATAYGEERLPPPDVLTLRGVVAGYPQSEVFLGLSPYGCNGFLNLEGEFYILAAEAGRDGLGEQLSCAVYRQSSIEWAPAPVGWCQAVVSPPEVEPVPLSDDKTERDRFVYRVCDIAQDTDAEYCDVRFGGNVAAAQAYIVELWAAISTVYERDMDVKLHVCYARVWTGSDPWILHGTEDGVLEELRDYWVANMGGIARTTVHKFCGSPAAGIAWGPGLCDYNVGYAITGILGSFSYPIQTGPDTWDLQAPMHELGHNFGSPHTHCYNPPIDHCFNCEGCSDTCPDPDDCNGCPDCSATCYHGPIECSFGSIMSYCDGCSPLGLANKDLRFHQRAIELVRYYVDRTVCMDYAMNLVYVDWSNGGYEDGSPQYPYTDVGEGLGRVIPGGTVVIRDGNYPETLLIRFPVLLEHQGEPGTKVIIGE
jgi:Metallo-peptidase family M12